jgi:RES domain
VTHVVFEILPAKIVAEPVSLRVFRNILIKPDGEHEDPFTPDPLYAGTGGRWETIERTLYTATTATTSWAEWCRNHPRAVEDGDPTDGRAHTPDLLKALAWDQLAAVIPARALVDMTFRFDRLADLTTKKAQQHLLEAGFNPQHLFADDYGRCPALAEDLAALGFEAVRVPSAALRDGICVAVFRAGRKPNDDWELVQARGRPPVAAALNTVYRHGERPGWVDGQAPRLAAA